MTHEFYNYVAVGVLIRTLALAWLLVGVFGASSLRMVPAKTPIADSILGRKADAERSRANAEWGWSRPAAVCRRAVAFVRRARANARRGGLSKDPE